MKVMEKRMKVLRGRKRKVSESREPTEETKERTTLSDCCREQQAEMETSRDGDKQKDADTKEKHSGGDSQKDQVKSGTEETKSYAAAAAAGKTKESKEKRDQTAVNQESTMESKRAQRFVALCLCQMFDLRCMTSDACFLCLSLSLSLSIYIYIIVFFVFF